MAQKNDGSPAFPCDLAPYDDEVRREMQGMTLRDYFAAKAMQGWMAGYPENQIIEHVACADVAALSYRLADAMLTARAK